ncbi:Dolichyldiphosphatase [Fasciola hepatica]|uniref:Dolichyldiphosphatase 1 n=1 Tax=Fasciola hepatica TaxID=6192 RepID=A0A4E0S284_FASHE|nr:Dolichyldiphosphatase [Fasciola hepatica]
MLAWCSMIPIFIAIGLVTLVLFKRDLFTMLYFSGLVLNRFCNSVMKKCLKQPRPVVPNRIPPDSFGMPSDHGQFMGFFFSFCVLLIILRLGEHSMKHSTRRILLLVCAVATTLTCYSRVYLKYHTVGQVLVGTIVGAILGIVWFFSVHCVFSPLFPRLCNSSIGQAFFIQDFTSIPNLLKFEYNNARIMCLSNSSACQTNAIASPAKITTTRNGEPRRARTRISQKN